MKKQLAVVLLILGLAAIGIYQSATVEAAESAQIKENDDNFKVDRSDPGFKGNQSDMNEAAYREWKRADDKLNEIYSQILIKYKDNQLFLDKLTDAELAWIKFRDAHLEALYPDKEPTYHYGSVYPMVYHLEKAYLTWARVKQLNQWLITYPEGVVGLGSRGQTKQYPQ